ncbi:MAG TPA: ThuA domain-containing protein [Verrucomicrobiales bacterium]|nr:ThuA domain-containing protein [Verrucomicrobiales bacterium]
MKKSFPLLLCLVTVLAGWFLVHAAEEKKENPLRILLVLGGCCHDYEMQQTILKAGIESRLNAKVDIEYNPDKSTETRFPLYEKADWADAYDVVIHDECSASVTDPAYVKRILDAHRKGIPAVNLHCAMHCYRWGNFKEAVKIGDENAGWYEMIGLQSTGHGPQAPIDITFTSQTHPITTGLENWTTVNEELYNNVQIFDSAKALATGRQIQMPKVKKGETPDPNAKGTEATSVVAWTNLYGPNKTRIFSTTIGHNNETVADDRYLDLISGAINWVTAKD